MWKIPLIIVSIQLIVILSLNKFLGLITNTYSYVQVVLMTVVFVVAMFKVLLQKIKIQII